jgi:hypothetical protein
LKVTNNLKVYFLFKSLVEALAAPELYRSPKEEMKSRHGHYCRICGKIKPNEAFSGKGHRNHICKICSRLPKNEIEAIDQKEEIFNFLNQSHISKKNISRLYSLVESPDEEVAKLAGIVLDVAKVKPYKKKRLKFLAREHRDLLAKLDETGLIFAHHH